MARFSCHNPGLDDPAPLNAATLTQLQVYARQPRGNRSTRPWTVNELLTLLDPMVPITAVTDQLGAKRAVVTYELVRLRWAGFSLPIRPCG